MLKQMQKWGVKANKTENMLYVEEPTALAVAFVKRERKRGPVKQNKIKYGFRITINIVVIFI